MNSALVPLDLILILVCLFTYLYLAFCKGSREMLTFFLLCVFWGSSFIWTSYIPNAEILFSERPGSVFPGYIITLGGLIYGIPFGVISLVTLFVKKKREQLASKELK